MATFDDTTLGTSTGGTRPDYGARKQSNPRTTIVQLGDGYEHRAKIGLNIDPKVWTLQWQVDESDADAIETFLEARAVDGAFFNWTPPAGGFTKTGTYSQSGTTVTITVTLHGVDAGDTLTIDYTSGSAVDGSFTVASVTNDNTFTVTAASSATNSGNVTISSSGTSKWVCPTFSKSIPYLNRATITATFREVFDVG